MFTKKSGGKPGAYPRWKTFVPPLAGTHVRDSDTCPDAQEGKTWKQDEVDGALRTRLTAAVSGISHLDTTVKSRLGD